MRSKLTATCVDKSNVSDNIKTERCDYTSIGVSLPLNANDVIGVSLPLNANDVIRVSPL